MWTDVLKIIDRLTRGPDLSVASVNAALGVELTPILDNPTARHFSAALTAGPLKGIELRESVETGISFLVLRANPDRLVVVPNDGLRQFGSPKWRAVEPKALPEGSVSECYDLGNRELRIGYGAMSRMLEVVAVDENSQ
jgi:hypothetical protein